MDKIEKIKAELDKRYQEYRAKMKTDDFTYYEGMADALDLFEQYIDTLSEEPDKSLEEEITRYGKEEMPVVLESDLNDIARHFAEWQKSQMLEDAVECELVCIKDCLAAILPMKEFRWTVGDNVRLIVLKEEEE